MEKISLYDLLSILLPGSLLTLYIMIVANDFNINLHEPELNQYFLLTIYLSVSIVLGSAINLLTRMLLENVYKKTWLYTPMQKLYKEMKKNQFIEEFYNNWFKMLGQISFEKKIETIWDEIYYYLEANEKISVPKSFQSFYFFFRNFFSLTVLLLIPTLVMFLYKWYSLKYTLILTVLIITMIVSIFAAAWNRKMMATRMFWTYYTLNKNK